MKVMDIREIQETKLKLAEVLAMRFWILTAHNNMEKREATVAALLAKTGPATLVTKQAKYDMVPEEGGKVAITVHQLQHADRVTWDDFPEDIRLFCNDAKILHNCQKKFQELGPDEVLQTAVEFDELAENGELLVVQGRSTLRVKRDGNQLRFDTVETYA